jgi:hypothetical protein
MNSLKNYIPNLSQFHPLMLRAAVIKSSCEDSHCDRIDLIQNVYRCHHIHSDQPNIKRCYKCMLLHLSKNITCYPETQFEQITCNVLVINESRTGPVKLDNSILQEHYNWEKNIIMMTRELQ